MRAPVDPAVDTGRMLDALGEVVGAESFSTDRGGVTRCAEVLAVLGRDLLGERAQIHGRDHPVVRWTFGGRTRVLLLGHLDTVWPMGTLRRWPFEVRDGIATGPGVFDMKAGLVQGLFALASLDDPDGVTLLINSDEETGSDASRDAIEELGSQAEAVLVLEPSERGALKVARKGQATYRIDARGRAAHSGLNPWDGANALVAIAHSVLALGDIAADDTTITPTLASAGTNWTAALGTPTLDGLGAVGGGVHAEGEHVVVDKMPERAALVTALVADLLAD